MKNLLFTLAFLLGVNTLLPANALSPEGTNSIIILDVILEVTADAYTSAYSVDVQVLDANGNVLASGQTTPGQTVSFSRTNREKKVVSTYHMDGGQNIVIVDEIMI